MNCSFCACAAPARPVTPMAAPRAARASVLVKRIVPLPNRWSLTLVRTQPPSNLSTSFPGQKSVREGPEPELLLADRPQSRQAPRLGDEEEDDERPEDHVLEGGDHRGPQGEPERCRQLGQDDRHDKEE